MRKFLEAERAQQKPSLCRGVMPPGKTQAELFAEKKRVDMELKKSMSGLAPLSKGGETMTDSAPPVCVVCVCGICIGEMMFRWILHPIFNTCHTYGMPEFNRVNNTHSPHTHTHKHKLARTHTCQHSWLCHHPKLCVRFDGTNTHAGVEGCCIPIHSCNILD
jgi:hypothetical protein